MNCAWLRDYHSLSFTRIQFHSPQVRPHTYSVQRSTGKCWQSSNQGSNSLIYREAHALCNSGSRYCFVCGWGKEIQLYLTSPTPLAMGGRGRLQLIVGPLKYFGCITGVVDNYWIPIFSGNGFSSGAPSKTMSFLSGNLKYGIVTDRLFLHRQGHKLTPYLMVWDWRVSRAGPMPFCWPSLSFFVFNYFPFLFISSIGW